MSKKKKVTIILIAVFIAFTIPLYVFIAPMTLIGKPCTSGLNIKEDSCQISILGIIIGGNDDVVCFASNSAPVSSGTCNQKWLVPQEEWLKK